MLHALVGSKMMIHGTLHWFFWAEIVVSRRPRNADSYAPFRSAV